MIYKFYKQGRIIKTDKSRLWVGGEIYVGQDILVRGTHFVVDNIINKGAIKIILLRDKCK